MLNLKKKKKHVCNCRRCVNNVAFGMISANCILADNLAGY